MQAAFFDLDKTVIAKSSTLAFGKPFYKAGFVGKRALMKMGFAQIFYLLFGADEDQLERARDQMLMLTSGWHRAEIEQLVEQTIDEVADRIDIGTHRVRRIVAHLDGPPEHGQPVIDQSYVGYRAPYGILVSDDVRRTGRTVVVDGAEDGHNLANPKIRFAAEFPIDKEHRAIGLELHAVDVDAVELGHRTLGGNRCAAGVDPGKRIVVAATRGQNNGAPYHC